MMSRPSWEAGKSPAIPIFLSHDHLEWQKIIKGTMDAVNLPIDQTHRLPFEAKFCATWYLHNKYYSVYVFLIVMHQNWRAQSSLLKSMAEAVIIYWDNTKNDSRQRLDDILSDLGELKPEVCLLVCDDFSEDAKVSRYDANQWCIQNGWELIELETECSSDSDADSLEDDFVESRGFQRVQGALHANRWSTMKQIAGSAPLDCREAMISLEDPFLGQEAPQDGSEEEPEEIDNGANGDNDADDFEDLFARFGQMRLSAASLSREDRLDYAERVATAFLGAIGDDDDDDEGGDTEEETNLPDADDSYAGNGYSELINSLDHMKLDGKSVSQADESSDSVSESGAVLSNNQVATEIGSTELLTELGFPVVEPETSGEGSQGSEYSAAARPEADTVKADISFTIDAQEEFQVRSYEDIEDELKQEEIEAIVRRVAATEEIRNEIRENEELSKKFRI
ncbi:hypothetical protein FHG87_009318 [Trinorchestia longiramus]|nr:hypothetical protein FHG87_009318 [Trinorchestia longiramus]